MPEGQDWIEANNLLAKILELKNKGLQGEQITRHFIKCRLAPIKERSKPAFEYEGQNDPNREDRESLNFQVLCARMYNIFSSGIAVEYSHKLPVAPFSLLRPLPPSNSLIISRPYKVFHEDAPARPTTRKAVGGPKIKPQTKNKRAAVEEETSKRASKRRLVVDDSDEDTEDVQAPKTNMTSLRPSTRSASKIRKSNRKPQEIDLTGQTENTSQSAEPEEPKSADKSLKTLSRVRTFSSRCPRLLTRTSLSRSPRLPARTSLSKSHRLPARRFRLETSRTRTRRARVVKKRRPRTQLKGQSK